MYVDESGDCGVSGSTSEMFLLSGLVVHESCWNATHAGIHKLRDHLYEKYQFPQEHELHAAEYINHPGFFATTSLHRRYQLLRDTVRFQSEKLSEYVRLIHVVYQKKGHTKEEVFEKSWNALIQRFENTIAHGNFPHSQNFNESGLIITDRTQADKLKRNTQAKRRQNLLLGKKGYYDLPRTHVVEYPMQVDSKNSGFVQLCDTNAYLLKQQETPTKRARRHGAHKFFKILSPILCTAASNADSQGIVRLG
jgi:hypothetical protein